MIVRLCSIECCFGHPLESCSLSGTEGGQGSFTADLEGWSAISNRLHIWDYTANFAEGARFAWTQEQLYPVRQWWKRASERQKERFFAAVGSGRLEITGTPFNVTALMSREEWETAMRWIPDADR